MNSLSDQAQSMQPLVAEAVGLLKSLAHADRLMICCQLRLGESSVSDLESNLGVPQPRLSRELAKLRNEGIVVARREAKSVHYRLSDVRIVSLVEVLCSVMHDEQDSTNTQVEPL